MKVLSVFLMISLIFQGCSAFRSGNQTITVTANQPDAEIYINGVKAGKGTVSMPVRRNENLDILVRKDGYIPVSRTIGKSLSTTGMLDILGGILVLIPIFGLLSAGAFELDEDNVHIIMIKV